MLYRQSRWNHTRIFSDFGDEDGSDEGDAELGMAKSVNSSYRGSKAFSSRYFFSFKCFSGASFFQFLNSSTLFI